MNRSEPPDTRDPLSTLSSAAARIVRRTTRSLSPWVQRELGRRALSRDPGQARNSGLAGAAAERSAAIFERIQRSSARGNVWNRQAESLSAPAHATDNFSGAVVQRFPDTSAKFERQSTGSTARGGAASAAAAAPAAPTAAPETADTSEIPGADSMGADIPSATFQEIRERIQRAQRPGGSSAFRDSGAISSAPDMDAPRAPSVQRTSTPAQPVPTLPPNFNRMPSDDVARPTRAERMRIRRFAHIEEVTSGAGPRPASPATDQPGETSAASAPEDAEPPRASAPSPTTGPEHRVQRSSPESSDLPAIQRKTASEPEFRPLPKPAAAARPVPAIEPERQDFEPRSGTAAGAPARAAGNAGLAVQRSVGENMPLVSARAVPEAERPDAASSEAATPIAPVTSLAPGARVQRKRAEGTSDDAGAPPVVRATHAPMPVARPPVSRAPATIQREGADDPSESGDDESQETPDSPVDAAEPTAAESADMEGDAPAAEGSESNSSDEDSELPLRRSFIQRSPELAAPADGAPSAAPTPGNQRARASLAARDAAPANVHDATELLAHASTADSAPAVVQRMPIEPAGGGSTSSSASPGAQEYAGAGSEAAPTVSVKSPSAPDSTATTVRSAVNVPLPLRVQRAVGAATPADSQTSGQAPDRPEATASWPAPLTQDNMPVVRRAVESASMADAGSHDGEPIVRRAVETTPPAEAVSHDADADMRRAFEPSPAADVVSHDAEPGVRRAVEPSAAEPAGMRRTAETTSAAQPASRADGPVVQRSFTETTKASAGNSAITPTTAAAPLPARSSDSPAPTESEGNRTTDVSSAALAAPSIQRSVDQAMPLHATQAAGTPELSSTLNASGEPTASIQRSSSEPDSERQATHGNGDSDLGGTATTSPSASGVPISQAERGEPSVRRQMDQAMPLRAIQREPSSAPAVTAPPLEDSTAPAHDPIIQRSTEDGTTSTSSASPSAETDNRPNSRGFRKLPPPTAIQRALDASGPGDSTGEQISSSAAVDSTPASTDAARTKTVQRAADPGMPVRARPRVSRPAPESSAGSPEASPEISPTADEVIRRQSLPDAGEASAPAGRTPPTSPTLSRLAPLRPAVQRSTSAAAPDAGQPAGGESGPMGGRDGGTQAPHAFAAATAAASTVQRQPRAQSGADNAAFEAPAFNNSSPAQHGVTAQATAAAPVIQRMPSADNYSQHHATAMPLVRPVGRAAPQATGTVQREIQADELAAQILGNDVRAPAPMRGARPAPESMTLRRMPLTVESPVIQRAPQTVTYISPMASSTGVLQRADDAKPGTTISPIAKKEAKKEEKKEEPKEAAAPDLDTLARQILPLLKRMLVVERERHVRR